MTFKTTHVEYDLAVRRVAESMGLQLSRRLMQAWVWNTMGLRTWGFLRKAIPKQERINSQTPGELVFTGIGNLAAQNPRRNAVTLMHALNATASRTVELNVKKSKINKVHSNTDNVGTPNKEGIAKHVVNMLNNTTDHNDINAIIWSKHLGTLEACKLDHNTILHTGGARGHWPETHRFRHRPPPPPYCTTSGGQQPKREVREWQGQG